MEIRAKCVKTFVKLLYVLWFYINCTQSQSADIFYFLRSCFSLVRFGQVRGNLGKNGVWSASNWKKCAHLHMRCNRFFFWGHFVWSFFRARLGKFRQNFFALPKICMFHTYVFRHCAFWTGRANVIEHSRVCGAAVIVSISPRFFHTISGNWQFVTGKQVRIRQYFVAAFYAAVGLHFTFSDHVVAA